MINVIYYTFMTKFCNVPSAVIVTVVLMSNGPLDAIPVIASFPSTENPAFVYLTHSYQTVRDQVSEVCTRSLCGLLIKK